MCVHIQQLEYTITIAKCHVHMYVAIVDGICTLTLTTSKLDCRYNNCSESSRLVLISVIPFDL